MKPAHYPFKYEQHNARAIAPTGRLVTNDGQILVDGILSADFGYHLALCVNACAGINPKAVPDLLETLGDELEYLLDEEQGDELVRMQLGARIAKLQAATAKAQKQPIA